MARGKNPARAYTSVSEGAADVTSRAQAEEVLLKAGALQKAIFNSAIFRASPPMRRASSRSSTWAPSGCWATPRPK